MDEDITCVAEVYGVLEGEWCRSLLEANGVPVMLSSEAAGSAYRVTVGSLGRVQVFVLNRFAQQAREILAAQDDSEQSDTPTDPPT
jgi:Putative prokaryotic signal transducing protein